MLNKKIIIGISLMVATMFANNIPTQQCVQTFKARIKTLLPSNIGINVKKVKSIKINNTTEGDIVNVSIIKTSVNGKKEVLKNATNMIYCNKDFFSPNLEFFDKNKTKIVNQAVISMLKDNAHLIKKGKDKKEYFIFSNPLCPFCKMYVPKILKKLQNTRYSIYLVDVPIEHLKKSKDFINKENIVLSNLKDANEKIAYLDEMYHINTQEKNVSLVENSFKKLSYKFLKNKKNKLFSLVPKPISVDFFMQYFGIRGTPTVLNNDGKIMNIRAILNNK